VEFLIVLAVLTVVVFVVTAPLRREPDVEQREAARVRAADARRAELEAARDAKYREIRDAELDHRTGKLSDSDYEALDGTLRSEAVEILRALDRAGGGRQPPS
jgi:hypothetical protein